jgi:hypothetical protein
MLLTLEAAIYFGLELVYKQNPNIISSTIFKNSPSNTSLNPLNFPFYIAVEVASNNLLYF